MHPIFLYISHLASCEDWMGRTEDLLEGSRPLPIPRCQSCGSDALGSDGKMIHRPVCVYYKAEGLQLKGLETMSVDGLIVRAAKIAAEAHRSQVRKYTNDPYVFHPMRVAGRITLLFKATPIEIAAAWLHDVLEDSSLNEEDLKDRGMPPSVIAYVKALTNPSKAMPKGTPRATRKATDFEHLARQPVWVRTIKLIDRIDNLMELSWSDKDFMALYCQESRGLAEAIGDAEPELKKELINAIDYFENELTHMQSEERIGG